MSTLLHSWDLIVAAAVVLWSAFLFRRWITRGEISFEGGMVTIRKNDDPQRFWRTFSVSVMILLGGLLVILAPRLFGDATNP